MLKRSLLTFLLVFMVLPWRLSSNSFADQDNSDKTSQTDINSHEKFGREIFGEWLTIFSIAGTEQVWDYIYQGHNDKSTLMTEKETFAKICLHFSNPYSHIYHFGIRFHDIIYYDKMKDSTSYIFSPEFTFGRNVMFTNWIGLRLYGGVGPWISIISNGDKQTNIAYSFGLQLPIRFGGLYVMPFAEYNINVINGLKRSIVYGCGVGW